MNPSAHEASEETKKTLFKKANESKWDEVIKIYKENPSARTDKITSSGDTALHIAVSNGKADIVKALVEAAVLKTTGALEAKNELGKTTGALEAKNELGKTTGAIEAKNELGKTTGALEAKNELGNTPLHLAAYLGDAGMCRCIAKHDTALMGIRNNDNETPFFLAVRHGRKEAFHALHSLCGDGEGYKYCRGKGGETILHSAIWGEYFELAYDIMGLYKKLLNAVNEQGFSPLHLLANKPSAFRSGSHIRGIHKLIYHCIFVDELHRKTMHAAAADVENKAGELYPKNYSTCVATFNLFTHVMRVLLGHSKNNHDEEKNTKVKKEEAETSKDHQQSEEHPNGLVNKLMIVLCGTKEAKAERFQFEDGKQQAAAGSSKRSAQGHEFLPKNYNTFFNFVKLMSKVTLVVLGLGSKAVEKIREKKAKHIWSIQIMNELLEQASSYQYEYNGKSPDITIPSAEKPTPYTLPDSAGEVDFNPTMVDQDIVEEPTPEQGKGTERNQTNNKAEGDKKPCGECRELLCSLLTSLGLVKHSAPLKALCPQGKGDSALDMEKKETPILIAAKSGVVEMVEGILSRIPVAIHDMNNEKKNVVLLAVEHRQPHVYKFLLDWKITKETIFRKTDKDGNSALHLAARLGEYRPWLIPGAALQMQWEIKWYEFVKDSMPHHFFPRHNRASETPRDIFNETHRDLAKEGGAWLTNTSQSCSVVAALIATVAFATSATVPGGVKSDNSGTPTLQDQPAFSIFAISSLVALCFSVTSVIMFLAILTSRFEQKDFGADLPRKLLVGLTSLFISIGSMLLSFCAGHFFVLKEKLQYAAFPMYAITCLPVTFFAAAQFPLYFDLIWATIRKVPQRTSK